MESHGSLTARRRPRFVISAVAAVSLAVLPVAFATAGCGGGGDTATTNPILLLPSALPDPNVPGATPNPGISPDPSPSPFVLPTPSPSPSVAHTPPPASGETLGVNEGVLVLSNASADLNIPTDTVDIYNDGFNIGAARPALGKTGNSAQVFFADVKNNMVRYVTIVAADGKGVAAGSTYSLGGVVNTVKDKNAFVLFGTRGLNDSSGATDKQWQSTSGQLIVERVDSGRIKLRVVGARMVPYTANYSHGQTGTFTLDGAGDANVTIPSGGFTL